MACSGEVYSFPPFPASGFHLPTGPDCASAPARGCVATRGAPRSPRTFPTTSLECTDRYANTVLQGMSGSNRVQRERRNMLLFPRLPGTGISPRVDKGEMTPPTRREFLQLAAGLFLAGCDRSREIKVGFTQASGVVPVQGAQLRYVIEGEGIPCLVLGHSESQRLLLSQALRRQFRFYFLDLRHDAESQNNSAEMQRTL